jgi:hypothetical protein
MSTPRARPRSSAETPPSAKITRMVAPSMLTTPRSSANSRSHSNHDEPEPARVPVIASRSPSGPSICQRPGSATSKETSSKTNPTLSYHSVAASSYSIPTLV